MGRDETLRNRRCGRCGKRNFHAFWILKEAIGQFLNFRRHCGREEQGLACKRNELGDALDIGNETHVEHAVGFVDDENLDGAHQKLAALEMVEQPAGGADQNVGAALELSVLVFEGNATDQKRDVQAVVLAVFLKVFSNLRSEFARRFEDQRTWHTGPCTTIFEKGQHRQHEGSGLARAGLRDAADVAAL